MIKTINYDKAKNVLFPSQNVSCTQRFDAFVRQVGQNSGNQVGRSKNRKEKDSK